MHAPTWCLYVRQGLWLENPDNDFDTEDFPYHTQLVSVFFIDIDADVESIGEEIVDVKIPYERVNFTAGGSFTATQNHMVRAAGQAPALGEALV